MSGRIHGSSEAQARQALALARGGAGPKRAESVWAIAEGLEAGAGATKEDGAGREGQGSCVVDLSRPPFPCSSDGLDLYTCRQAMRAWGAEKGAAGPASRRGGPDGAGSKEDGGRG